MRMSHKQKTKLARRMRTPLEISRGTPIFSSRAWNVRRRAGIAKMFRGCKNLRETGRLAKILSLAR